MGVPKHPPQDRTPLRAVLRAPQMVEQLVEVPMLSPLDCTLVPQMGNELVVEVPKIESYSMFSAAFLLRSGLLPEGSGFRRAENQGLQGFLSGLSLSPFRGAEHLGHQGSLLG